MKIDHKGNPWKGLASYTYQDADCFYGRNQELREIVGVIKQNAFTTLYGISGAGKTSIINAGLIPLLDKQSYLPIYIRLDHNVGHIPYDTQIIQAVNEAICHVEGETEDIVGQNLDSEFDKLWLYFHSHKFWSKDNHILTPIIFIDQFEEIFTKNEDAENIWAFFNVVDSLQYSTPTERILNTIENTDKFISFGEEQNFRVVFSMREDFLARLEDYSYNIPALRKNRIGLKPLNGLQALDVILSPRPDMVNRKVALHIISKIVGRKVSDNARRLETTYVDTSMLSLFCTELYNYAMEDNKGEITIQLVDLYGENILEWFYDRNMQILPKQTYIYLENQLLTHSGFRNSVALDDLLLSGVLQGQLDILAENRIIRIEDVNHNMRVEFTHDVLCKIAKKRKDARDKIARMKGEESALRAFTIDNVVIIATIALFALAVYYVGIDGGLIMALLSFPILSFFYALIIGRSMADCNLSKVVGFFCLACGIELSLVFAFNEMDRVMESDYAFIFFGIGMFIPIALLLFPYAILIKKTLQNRIKILANPRTFILSYVSFVLFQSAWFGLSGLVHLDRADAHLIVLFFMPSLLVALFPIYALYRNIKEKESPSMSVYTLLNSVCILSAVLYVMFSAKGYVSIEGPSDATSITLCAIWGVVMATGVICAIQYSKVPKQHNIMDYVGYVTSFQVLTKYKSFKTRLCTIMICFIVFLTGVVATRYWDLVPFISLPLTCVLVLHLGCTEFKMTTLKSAFSPKILFPLILLAEVIVACQYLIGGIKNYLIYASALAITITTFLYLINKEQIRQRYLFVIRVLVLSIGMGCVLPVISIGYNIFNPDLSSISRVWGGAIPTPDVKRFYFLTIENAQGEKGVMDYSEVIIEPQYKYIGSFKIVESVFSSVYPIRGLLREMLEVKNGNYSYEHSKGIKIDMMSFPVLNKNNVYEKCDYSHFLFTPNKYGRAYVQECLKVMNSRDISLSCLSGIINKNNRNITENERKQAILKIYLGGLCYVIAGTDYLNVKELNGDTHNVKVLKQCLKEVTLKPLLENIGSLNIEDVHQVSMDYDYLFAYDYTGQLKTIVLDGLWDKLPHKTSGGANLNVAEGTSMAADKAYLYLLSGDTEKAISSAKEAVKLDIKGALDILMIALHQAEEPVNFSDVLEELNMSDVKIGLYKEDFYERLRAALYKLEKYGVDINRKEFVNDIISMFESENVNVSGGETFNSSEEYELLFSEVQSFEVKGVSFQMVKVKGGTFNMGSNADDAESDESPIHPVTLSDYFIGETEVTQELWGVVMGTSPSYFTGDKLPVENVSWDDCQEFIRKLNEMTGKNFRLPTEAEWEYAARGGRRSYGEKYAGGSDIDGVAWYDGNSGETTSPVGQQRANELGLYDMSGNVWEWCQDWYGDYSSSSQTNPTGPATGSNRVERGGSWSNDATFCRVAYRYYNAPGGGSYLGLRLAL